MSGTGAELIAGKLAAAGCRMAYGIPGGEVLALVDALDRAGIRFVLTKHETPAGFFAEGGWHATGAPGVLVATVGPGIANAVNVVANAQQDRVPLIVISGQAFLSRANANWAASAYPAGVLLLTAWGLAHARKWFFGGLALNAALALFLIVLTMFPAVADALGQSNAFKRMRGWEAMTEQVIEAAQDGGYGLIAPDDRFVFQTMDYYARNRNERPVMKMWLRHEAPHNHAEMIAPLPQETEGPILIVSKFEDHIEWLERDFERLEPVGEIVIPVGGGRTRTLRLYEAEGYAPVPRN